MPLYSKLAPTGTSDSSEAEDTVQVGVLVIMLTIAGNRSEQLISADKDSVERYIEQPFRELLLSTHPAEDPSMKSALYLANVKKLRYKDIGGSFLTIATGLLFPKLSSEPSLSAPTAGGGKVTLSRMRNLVSAEPKAYCLSLSALVDVFALNYIYILLVDALSLSVSDGNAQGTKLLEGGELEALQRSLAALFPRLEESAFSLLKVDLFLLEAVERMRRYKAGLLQLALLGFHCLYSQTGGGEGDSLASVLCDSSRPQGRQERTAENVQNILMSSLCACWALGDGGELLPNEVTMKVINISFEAASKCAHDGFTSSLPADAYFEIMPIGSKLDHLRVCGERRVLWELLCLSARQLKVLEQSNDPVTGDKERLYYLQSAAQLLKGLMRPVLEGGIGCVEDRRAVEVYLVRSCGQCVTGDVPRAHFAFDLVAVATSLLRSAVMPAIVRLGGLPVEEGTVRAALCAYMGVYAVLLELVNGTSFSSVSSGLEDKNNEVSDDTVASFKYSCLKRYTTVPPDPSAQGGDTSPSEEPQEYRMEEPKEEGKDEEALKGEKTERASNEETDKAEVTSSDDIPCEETPIRRVLNAERMRLCIEVYHACTVPVLRVAKSLRSGVSVDEGAVATAEDLVAVVTRSMLTSPYCGLLPLLYLKSSMELSASSPPPVVECVLCGGHPIRIEGEDSKVAGDSELLETMTSEGGGEVKCVPPPEAAALAVDLGEVLEAVLSSMVAISGGTEMKSPHCHFGDCVAAERSFMTLLAVLRATRSSLRSAVEADYMKCIIAQAAERERRNGLWRHISFCVKCTEDCTFPKPVESPQKAEVKEGTSNESIPTGPKDTAAGVETPASEVKGREETRSDVVLPPPRLRGAKRTVCAEDSAAIPTEEPPGDVVDEVKASPDEEEVSDSAADEVVKPKYIFLGEAQVKEVCRRREEAWKRSADEVFLQPLRTSSSALLLQWMERCEVQQRKDSVPSRAISRLSSPNVSVSVPSWGKLSEISAVLATRTTEIVCRATCEVPAIFACESTPNRSDFTGRLLETKLALQCMKSCLSYLAKRVAATVKCVSDVRGAYTSNSKSPSGTSNEINWDSVDAVVTNEVSAVVDLLETFVAGYTYTAPLLTTVLVEPAARRHWVEVSGTLFTSLSELLSFYGYLGEHGEALLLEMHTSSSSPSAPSLLDRLGTLVHSLLDVTSVHFAFGTSTEYSIINTQKRSEREIRLGQVSEETLQLYLQNGPLMLLQLLSLQHFVVNWLVAAETPKTKSAQQLLGNKVYRDIKDRIHPRVTHFVSDFVALEAALTLQPMAGGDTSFRCPPAHSCCVPIAVLGSEVRQVYTSFGMLLALRLETTLTSFPPLPGSLKGCVSDYATGMMALLRETALISLHRTERKPTRLTSDFVSFLQQELTGDSGTKSALIGRLLSDYGESMRTSYTLRLKCPADPTAYLQALTLYDQWRTHQWKMLGNFLACRAESIAIMKSLSGSEEGREDTEEKSCEVRPSLEARLYMCASLSYGAARELCQRGLDRHEIVKLLLCREEEPPQEASLHKSIGGRCLSAHFVSTSGLRAVLSMQRSLQASPLASAEGHTNEANARHGALSHQMKLFLLQRYTFHVVERSLLNKVRSRIRTATSSSVAHFVSSTYSGYGVNLPGNEVNNSVTAAMVSWQEEAASLHKQLRVLLHEGTLYISLYLIIFFCVSLYLTSYHFNSFPFSCLQGSTRTETSRRREK